MATAQTLIKSEIRVITPPSLELLCGKPKKNTSGNFSHRRLRRRYDADMLLRLLLLLAIPMPLFSQTVTGTLEGHVTDTSGAAIGGVKITAKSVDTGLTRSTAADGNG